MKAKAFLRASHGDHFTRLVCASRLPPHCLSYWGAASATIVEQHFVQTNLTFSVELSWLYDMIGFIKINLIIERKE